MLSQNKIQTLIHFFGMENADKVRVIDADGTVQSYDDGDEEGCREAQ